MPLGIQTGNVGILALHGNPAMEPVLSVDCTGKLCRTHVLDLTHPRLIKHQRFPSIHT